MPALPLTASPVVTPAAPAPASLAFAALFAGVLAPLAMPAVALLSAATRTDSDAAHVEAQPADDAAAAETEAKGDAPVATPEVDTKSVVLGAAALGLDPTLKAALARVIVRMKQETGRDVTVVEGVRSQERQDALYAQGRSTGGPVVTWTRHSQHSAGRAVDVAIDGRYDDAAGFAMLRKIAAEEGLHTLGARDPGHLELEGTSPRGQGVASDATEPMSPALSTPIVRATGVARVASVAAVANVARVASVAKVATVASVAAVARVAAPANGGVVAQVAPQTASSSGSITMERVSAVVASEGAALGNVAVANVPAAKPRATKIAFDGSAPVVQGDPAATTTSSTPVIAAHGAGHGASRDGGASQQDGESGSDPRRSALRARSVEGRVDSRLGEASYQGIDRASTTDTVDGTATPLKSDASALTEARASRVMSLQDAPAPRTLSRLTLSLDDGRGGQDQVHIGLRGSSIGASFDMRDAGGADRIAARMGELTRALEQHGLEPQAFQVRSSATARDGDVARLTTQQGDAPRGVLHTAGANAEQRFGTGDQARQQFSQHDDQRERAQRRQDDQRRRGTSFSLTTEAS